MKDRCAAYFYDRLARNVPLNSTKLLEFRDKTVHILNFTTTLPWRGLCVETSQ